MKFKSVRCKSGIKGWRGRLQDVYNSYDEFFSYCSIYGNHTRLGFDFPEDAWKANPVIQGSVIPSDYQKIKE